MEIIVAQKLLRANDQLARQNRHLLDEAGVFAVNVLGAPGAGKTTLLEALLPRLQDRFPVAVIEGDQATSNDAERLEVLGFRAVQINTGSACHLDAGMVAAALEKLDLLGLKFLFIENVGNLICPAEFDLGEHFRLVVLGATEGDDKVAKYPAMFQCADALAINKMDLAAYFAFDLGRVRREMLRLAPETEILPLSAKTGEGVDACAGLLATRRERWFVAVSR